MKKLTILLLFPVFVCAQTTTKVIRVPLGNKDTFVTTITTVDKTVTYTTTSVTVDTITLKYKPPVIVTPPSTGQTLKVIDGWNAYVHLPASYNTGSQTYPTIIFFPGTGEVGTTASLVINNGPGAYITQGWNGNVSVDGATVEFIVISLQPSAQYPTEPLIDKKIQAIKSLYRVNPNKLYLTGLSMGGWCASTYVTGDSIGKNYYASQIAAVVEVQGVTPDDNKPYPDLFDNFVKSGGKFLGFEQRLDNRGVPTRVNRMNATVPGSAIYVQTNFGTGGHCCWEQFYGGKGVQPGNFLLGGVTQNLYQWMARQSLKGTASVTPPGNVGSACNQLPPKTWIINPTTPGEIYITNASGKGWKGGDTLKIPAGTYSVIEIDSFSGDACRDIVIINDGGLVNVTGSIRIQKDVRYVKVLGNGAPGITYGFKCKNFAFNRVNHFTMGNIECGPNLKTATNSGGVGIYGKQDPYANQPWTWYPNYVSTKITINNCYVHDVDGEGMYIGHTYPDGDPDQGNRIPIRLDSVTISNCIVENCGWDGIQVSNARSGNKIFNNKVTNFGWHDFDGQRAGIISGGNSQTDVYNNTVTNGMGNGIEFFGYGLMKCYGNTITNVGNTLKHVNGEESIYAMAYLNKVEKNPPMELVVDNNQINEPKLWGIIRVNANNNTVPTVFINNKVCMAAGSTVDWKSIVFLEPDASIINNSTFCKN